MRTDGFPNVTIRGIGGFGNTQGVGFYLDDVQVFSDASSRFGDLDRIEVLKGPQGTLYGGSNIGGAVKFVSARPDPSETFGRVKGRFGEQSLVDVEAAANIPLGQSGWATRVFGFFYEDDGFLVNRNPPRINGLRGNENRDIGAVEEYGGRITVSGPLGDRVSAFAAVRWNEMDGFSNIWMRELTDDFQYDRAVNNSTNSTHLRDTVAGTVELEWELDNVSVLSLTSYTSTNSTRYTDADILEEFIFDANRPEDMDVFTQELRFTSTNEGPLTWLAGAYYSLYAEQMRSTQIWWDARVDADGNITGALGCAIGMPTCSGVLAWRGGDAGTGDGLPGRALRDSRSRQVPRGGVRKRQLRLGELGARSRPPRGPVGEQHGQLRHGHQQQPGCRGDTASGLPDPLAHRGVDGVLHLRKGV